MPWPHVNWWNDVTCSLKNAITLLRAIPTVAFQCIYFWHILTYIWWHSIWIYLTYYLTFYEILCGIFTIEAPQCPLTSGSCRWGLAGPLGSGSRCWARRWGPTVPTDIWRLRLRPGSAHWDLERLRSEAGGGRRRQAAPLIKSRDPHLACMAMHNAKKKFINQPNRGLYHTILYRVLTYIWWFSEMGVPMATPNHQKLD